MITPDQVVAKANRLYPQAVQAYIERRHDAAFPWVIPAKLKPDQEISSAISQVDALRKRAKQTLGYGYTITWTERRSRSLGLNQFPTRIEIDTFEDLIRLVGKQQEWRRLQVAIDKLQSFHPELAIWLAESNHWKRLLEVAESLDQLLMVVKYFQDHPRPNCFARELPLPISTKLIERNRHLLSQWLDRVLSPQSIDARFPHSDFELRYGLRYPQPHLMVRLLDDELRRDLGLPVSELSMPAESLARLPVKHVRVVIVENKVNLLTLPRATRTIALGGLGNAVTQLATVPWLASSDLFYWGDMDVEGFQILSRLRNLLPQTRSTLMDRATLESCIDLVTPGNVVAPHAPLNLTPDEHIVYNELLHHQWRLEQEHIPQAWVNEHWIE